MAANSDLRRMLVELVRRQAAMGPLPSPQQNSLVAQSILSAVPLTQPYQSEPVLREDIRGPSPIMRVLDLMSRPLYAVANPIKETVEQIESSNPTSVGDIINEGLQNHPQYNLGAVWRGFSGQDKTTGADIFEAAGEPPGLRRAALGLGFDVALDPTSYVGVGVAKNVLGRVASKSVNALRGVEEGTALSAQEITQEISRRAAEQANKNLTTEIVPDPVTPRSTIPSRGQIQDPPRVFQAGTRSTPLQLPPGPNRPSTIETPLDTTAISFIKQGLQRGLSLDDAALRPLTTLEHDVLERGIASGTSARQLERQLAEATGVAPSKPFAAPTPLSAANLSDDQMRQIDELVSQRERVLEQIDDLEMQTSGTASPEVLSAELRSIESRLQEIAPQLQQLRQQISNTSDPTVKGQLAQQFERLTQEREQLLQRSAAQTEETLEATTIGPAGSTRTIINQQINELEAQARALGQQIEQIRRPPSQTISTPIPKPQTVTEILQEAIGEGNNWQKLVERQAIQLPESADRLTIIKALQAQKSALKSPVQRNMIDAQIRKIQEGVTPADLLSQVRTRPPDFPEITLRQELQDEAGWIAENFLKANKAKNINHIGQSKLYNRISNWAQKKIRKDRRANAIYQMLRIAENKILEQGRHLVDAEGISVRLTDIANMAGGAKSLTTRLVDDFRNARPSQKIEDLKAATVPAVAEEVLDPIIQTAKNIAPSLQNLPPSRTVQVSTELSRELSKLAEAAGASTREAAAAKRFMDDFFSPNKDQLYNDVMQEARSLIRQSMDGVVNASMLHKINSKVYDALGGNPKILGKEISQNKVVEAVMSRFATWWNAKDLRPFAKEYIDTARNVAAAFEKALTPLVRNTTPTQRTQAWRVAQGRIAAGSTEEAQLAQRFQYLIENLLGAHGLNNAESVLIRSGTTLKEINKELPPELRFIDKIGEDELGRTFDYTDGNWMHSWKEWEVKEPAEALYRLTRALQLVTRKNAMLDDAAARWGMPVKGAEFIHQVDIPRLQGFYFPKQIADQLSATWRRFDTDVFKSGPPFLQLIDRVQSMWKTGVTIYSPSHHIRNLNGDIFLNALDGVVTTTPYLMSTKVLHAFKSRYKDIENVFQIMDPKLRDAAIKARPGKIILETRGGHRLTAEQIYQAAESQGFLLRAPLIEDIMGDASSSFGTFGARFQPLGGHAHRTAAGASELRDHWVRMAHFIDVLRKSKTKSLRDAIEIAGRRVKKFHPDGSDLTGFEQNVMRRLIPFYSWLRKATPLIIEGAVMRPHITLAFPKAMANLQEITGVESEGPGNPFPMDQMFPDWLKEKGIGPVLPEDHPLAGIGRQETWRGEAPGYTIINPTNPFLDQISQLGNPRQTAISSLSPFLRVPVELATGHTALGIPLEEIEGGMPGHLAQQVPAVGIGARVTGLTRPDEPWHPEQLINYLTAAGVTGTGPYESQAAFEIQEMLNNISRRRRREQR